MTRDQAPNRYGSDCCSPCAPVQQTYIPDRLECDIPLCPDGTPSTCHCLFEDLWATFPQYRCLGGEALCAALQQSSCFLEGMLVLCQKSQATLFLAAHILETTAIATTEASSRLAAVANGSMLPRPTSDTGLEGWLSLSPWGIAVSALIELNPRIGVIAVG